MEASEKRGWTILTLKKIAVLIPYIIRLAYIAACIGVALLAVDMVKTSGAELEALIEAGDLPECVMTYSLGLFGMLCAAILLLINFKRR